ncbi:unnamed protein product [Heterobilharzia americana]|nr:unnamed protein product [Heterobilharzia americana]
MVEEETYLPENHPLQKYFRDIGVSDAVSYEISKKPNALSVLRFSSHLLPFLKWIKSLNFSLPFWFSSPLIRLFWLRNVNLIRNSDLLIAENKLVVEYICCTGNRDQTSLKRWIFAMFPILAGLAFYHSMYMASVFLMIISCLLIPDIFLLMVSEGCLASALKQMKNFFQGYRSVVLFLQDLNTRRYFGPKIVDKETFKLFPLIYHQTYSFMQIYLAELVDFSVKLADFIDENDTDVPLEILTSELVQLKFDVKDASKDPSIENLKMFCELSKILVSDLLIRLSLSFCQRTCNTCHIFHRSRLLWKWNSFLNRIKDRFDKMNELHTMILNGKLTNGNNNGIVKDCSSQENEKKSLYNPLARITNELLLHLLVSVEHANNLKSYIELKDNTTPSDETFSKLLNLVRCQLNASVIFLNELDSSVQEDDVLEDIAVGTSSDDESETEHKNNGDLDSLKNPSSVMHPCVLKELKNVISHRRLIMQEREDCAIKRRLLTDCPEDQKEYLSINGTDPSVRKESQTQFTLENGHGVDDNAYPNVDVKLSEFFPTRLYNSMYQDFKSCIPFTRRNLKSSVLKRNMIFTQFSSVTFKDYASQNYKNSLMLTNISQSENLSDKRVLQCSSFANALFAQRKLLGYADEDCFTGIGSGEKFDEVVEEISSKNS